MVILRDALLHSRKLRPYETKTTQI